MLDKSQVGEQQNTVPGDTSREKLSGTEIPERPDTGTCLRISRHGGVISAGDG